MPEVGPQIHELMQVYHLTWRQACHVQQQMQRPGPCLLCGSPHAAIAAVFMPDRPECWGGTRGRQRLVGYRVCPTCFARPGVQDQAEAKLAQGIVGRNN